MARSDHIYVYRGPYTHHGVDVGNGLVIDFTPVDGDKRRSLVQRVRIEDFARGAEVHVRAYGSRLDPDEAVARAESMLGSGRYHLLTNNCEHLATWCVAGVHSSAQVESATSAVGGLGLLYALPVVGLALVGEVGDAALRSGPNLMSGLARVGGSAVGGMVVLGGGAGLLTLGATCLALPDKPTLTYRERAAREAAKYGAAGGAALGTGAVVYAVGAAGIAGYSAAGISSGLAALGSVAGGSMALGVMLVALTPALFALLGAYLLFGLTHRSSSNAPTRAV